MSAAKFCIEIHESYLCGAIFESASMSDAKESHEETLKKIRDARIAEDTKKRLEKGDQKCISCGSWRSDSNYRECYGTLRCKCGGRVRCGNCLNPNHVY